MASLGELVAAAQATREAQLQSNPTANAVSAGFAGYMAGRQAGLHRALAMLDIQEKLAKIAESQQNARIQGNLAKGMGLLPMTPDETMAARATANDALGNRSAPALNNTRGKLSGLLENLGISRVDVSPTGGLTWRMGPQKAGKTDAAASAATALNTRKAVVDMATKMATSDMANQARAAGKQDFEIQALLRGGPSPDAVQKFLPTAAKYFGEDPAKYAPAAAPAADPNDPLAGLDDLPMGGK